MHDAMHRTGMQTHSSRLRRAGAGRIGESNRITRPPQAATHLVSSTVSAGDGFTATSPKRVCSPAAIAIAIRLHDPPPPPSSPLLLLFLFSLFSLSRAASLSPVPPLMLAAARL
ncbi:hypothetical protein Dda_8776 [Drechslerella dactyloides]|uniref:Uncharacterized protein n=1 Tax=Drechslerella dactyloides TaxID=74499 RepID=A0AAD6IR18_DREDA|nr:hypothetical protein Dda_8776 [Drechslerella dactyloides]